VWSPGKLLAAGAFVGVGIVVGGGLVYLLHDSSDPSPVKPDGNRAYSEVVEPQAGRLAERFRPWLRFDSGERWLPVSVESLLAEREPDGAPAQKYCSRSLGKPSCEPIDGLSAFEELISTSSTLAAPTYIQVAGRHLSEYNAPGRSEACRKAGLSDCGEAPKSAIYYRVTESNERFYIDYWWFLRYNHFPVASDTCIVKTELCDEHEGDWEGVTLVTLPNDGQHLDYVVYAAHRGTFRYPADQLTLHQDRRPEVFVAKGSHASYPQACSGLCWQPIAFVGSVRRPETSVDGGRPWPRNEEKCEPDANGSCLLALPSAEPGKTVWTTWPGLWGATCGKVCKNKGPQSPASPGLQTRFQTPWCSTSSAGTPICDTTAQGCSDWLGPLVAVLACDPKALAQGLIASEQLPKGGLKLTVTPANGKTRRLSAATRGVVQALGSPLRPGSRVKASGVGGGTELMIRARKGNHALEARYDPYPPGATGGDFEIMVKAQHGVPVLRGTRASGVEVEPEEERRLHLPPAP
jgi:hypothetical protein